MLLWFYVGEGEGERGREGQTICPGAPTFQTVLKYKWQHTIQEWEQVLSNLLVSLRISWRGAFLVCFFPEPRPTCRGELLGLQNTHSYSYVHYKCNHMIIWLWHKKTSHSQLVPPLQGPCIPVPILLPDYKQGATWELDKPSITILFLFAKLKINHPSLLHYYSGQAAWGRSCRGSCVGGALPCWSPWFVFCQIPIQRLILQESFNTKAGDSNGRPSSCITFWCMKDKINDKENKLKGNVKKTSNKIISRRLEIFTRARFLKAQLG